MDEIKKIVRKKATWLRATTGIFHFTYCTGVSIETVPLFLCCWNSPKGTICHLFVDLRPSTWEKHLFCICIRYGKPAKSADTYNFFCKPIFFAFLEAELKKKQNFVHFMVDYSNMLNQFNYYVAFCKKRKYIFGCALLSYHGNTFFQFTTFNIWYFCFTYTEWCERPWGQRWCHCIWDDRRPGRV